MKNAKKREKRRVKFLDNGRISFSPVSTLYFEPSMSNGTEDDSITFLNLPIVVSEIVSTFCFAIQR